MIEPVAKIWLDGQLVDWDAAVSHVLTDTLHYGFGAFDGIRSYEQAGGGVALFQVAEHVGRLLASAGHVGIEVPFDREALVEACHEVVAANDLRDSYVRPLVFVGGPHIIFAHWLNPVHVAVAAFPWKGYKDRSGDVAVSAKVSPYRRPQALAELYKAKLCGHYLLSIVAFADASRTGYQQAIFLDEGGLVCEATADNVFVVKGGELATPTEARPILPGLVRECVLRLAGDLGYRVVERDFGAAELAAADEVFTTGTASGILAVGAVDGKPVGDGGVGPVTRSLQERFAAVATGLVRDDRGWLVPVRTRVGTRSGSGP